MDRKVLLIGGAGYVGSVITFHFLKKGYKVAVLDKFVYKNQASVESYIGDPGYEFFYGDFGNNEILAKASKNVTDVVILGGLVGDPITKKYQEEANVINIIAVKNCIDFYKDSDIKSLLFISTCSNYGLIKEDKLANEQCELTPLSLYAKAKVGAEEYLLAQKGKVNYTGTILRFATAFGLSPRMRFDLTISEFTRDLFTGKELLVFDENTWRPYCHVRDFARLIDLVMHTEREKVNFEVFNAGGNVNNFTKKMVIDKIVEYVPNSKVSYTENGSDPRNYKVDFSKVRNVLGFEPQYSVEFGIKELVDAMGKSVYSDSVENKNKYGNFELDYKL